MSAQTAADLRAAADILRRDGWRQGAYVGSDGCRCTAGAIYAATGCATHEVTKPWQYERVDRACRALADFLGQGRSGSAEGAVIVWNDRIVKDEAEVIAALEAAADTADQATHGSHGQH